MPWVVTFLKSNHIRHAPNLITADTDEKINTPKSYRVLRFTRKVSRVIVIEGG